MVKHMSCMPFMYLTPCIDSLFNRSVRAEVERYPELLTVTTADVDRDPPPRLFPKRLKGYFKVPALSRSTILKGLAWVGTRGEFMTQWKDPNTGEGYDGSIILAHALDIFYLAHMEPACSVNFQDPGYIASTSDILKKIRRLVPCLLNACVHVSYLTFLLVYTQDHLGVSHPFVS